MATTSPTKFAHVVYRTRRFEQMLHWYEIVFAAKVRYQNPALAFLTYDDEHHRFAFVNLSLFQPEGTETDKIGVIGVDHVAYTYASLSDLLENYAQLKEKGITPYWCIHHGVTVSIYYADPDGNQMEFQVDSFDSKKEANAFMYGPGFSANPIGVEFEPEEWLARVRAGAPTSDFLIRQTDEPVSSIRGVLGRYKPDGNQAADVARHMYKMVTSHWVPQIVRAAVDLSLADHLAEGCLTADEVAQREESSPTTTFRLMRACVVLGLLTADAKGLFQRTPLLDTLRKDALGSMTGLALATTLPSQWLAWNAFTASVRTGQSQAFNALGTDFFDYLENHPSEARDFSEGMKSTTSIWTRDAARVIDTTGVKLAVDIGGANGSLLHLLLEDNPSLRGIIFDRPNIVDEAAAETATKGLTERTRVLAGDFFESVPSADMYLLKMVLHDWDDESCVKILKNCRDAMNSGGRIVIIEMIVGEISDPGPAALMDMNMLALVAGQERSLSEYEALFSAAGLRRTTVIPTSSAQSVIEAVVASTPPAASETLITKP